MLPRQLLENSADGRSPLSRAPVSPLQPVPDMSKGIEWAFEIPILCDTVGDERLFRTCFRSTIRTTGCSHTLSLPQLEWHFPWSSLCSKSSSTRLSRESLRVALRPTQPICPVSFNRTVCREDCHHLSELSAQSGWHGIRCPQFGDGMGKTGPRRPRSQLADRSVDSPRGDLRH